MEIRNGFKISQSAISTLKPGTVFAVIAESGETAYGIVVKRKEPWESEKTEMLDLSDGAIRTVPGNTLVETCPNAEFVEPKDKLSEVPEGQVFTASYNDKISWYMRAAGKPDAAGYLPVVDIREGILSYFNPKMHVTRYPRLALYPRGTQYDQNIWDKI